MQVLANGIISGLSISLMALSFSVVYMPTNIFAISLAAIYVATPYFAWMSIKNGYNGFAAVIISVSFAVILSILTELLNHWPLEKKKTSHSVHMVSSLGIYILLVQIIVIKWGNETKVLRIGIDTVYHVYGVVLTNAQLIALIVPIVTIAAFVCWLKFTSMGLRFRALAENQIEFGIKGFNVRYTRLVAFFLSGLFVAICSLVISNDIGFDPNRGLNTFIIGVVAAIIGGRTSFFGAIIGGVLIGIVRAETSWLLSARWVEAVTFFLLALFLFFRPNGLIGSNLRLEASK